MSSKNKQAVVLIHGIGEQVPMDTLRGFVDAVWTSDKDIHHPHVEAKVWSKPDEISEDLELRRLTTSKNREEIRTDFFEFYWANLMEGTRLSHLVAWARVLLLRRPGRIPKQLQGVWWFLVCLAIGILVGGVLYQSNQIPISPKTAKIVGGVASILWVVVAGALVKVAGDAARYLHVAPPNIERRRKIREAGLRLLERLHDSKEYDRIILVGHSLGTVIGYDILTHLWPRFNRKHASENPRPSPALEKLEALSREPKQDGGWIQEYRKAQQEFLEELQAQGNPWLVSDFVTMGSPLAHASLLLARTADEFDAKKEEREFPTCPPVLETVDHHKRFSFLKGKTWVPHHAAVFAPTRWTNLYFPCRWTLWGDLIGGPLSPQFGSGLIDVAVQTDLQDGLFVHSCYWKTKNKSGVDSHILEVRKAVNI